MRKTLIDLNRARKEASVTPMPSLKQRACVAALLWTLHWVPASEVASTPSFEVIMGGGMNVQIEALQLTQRCSKCIVISVELNREAE